MHGGTVLLAPSSSDDSANMAQWLLHVPFAFGIKFVSCNMQSVLASKENNLELIELSGIDIKVTSISYRRQ